MEELDNKVEMINYNGHEVNLYELSTSELLEIYYKLKEECETLNALNENDYLPF